jgi:hypothetical protein
MRLGSPNRFERRLKLLILRVAACFALLGFIQRPLVPRLCPTTCSQRRAYCPLKGSHVNDDQSGSVRAFRLRA